MDDVYVMSTGYPCSGDVAGSIGEILCLPITPSAPQGAWLKWIEYAKAITMGGLTGAPN